MRAWLLQLCVTSCLGPVCALVCLHSNTTRMTLGLASQNSFRWSVEMLTESEASEPINHDDCVPLDMLSSPFLDPDRNLSGLSSLYKVGQFDGWVGIYSLFGTLEMNMQLGSWHLLDSNNVTVIYGAMPTLHINQIGEEHVQIQPIGVVKSQRQSCLENGGKSWSAEPGFTPPFFADRNVFAWPITQAKYDSSKVNCYPAGFDGRDAPTPKPPEACLTLMQRLCPNGPNLWRCLECLEPHSDALNQSGCSNEAQRTFCSRAPHDSWPESQICPSALATPNTDVVSPVRTKESAHGELATSLEECCRICSRQSDCVASIFADTNLMLFNRSNCWPLAGYTSLVISKGRTVSIRSDIATINANARVSSKKISNGSVTWWSRGRRVDWILAPVNSSIQVFSILKSLSGSAKIPPKYAFGFLATYWGWGEQSEVESNISAFRENDYPIDAFIMDYDWFGTSKADYKDFGYNTKTMTKPPLFPDLKSMLRHYRDAYDVRFGGIRKPVTYDHVELVHDHRDWAIGWSPTANELNFTTKELREWHTNGTAPLVDDGVQFFWNDEADFAQQYFAYHYWTMGQQAACRRIHGNSTRVWSINRAFTPGLQRHGGVTWSGDGQDCSQNMTMTMSIFGQPYSCCDMTSPDATVLVRQYQTAVFSPIMRVHGGLPLIEPSGAHPPPRFPFVFCGEGSAGGGTAMHCSAFRTALQLRYHFVPYFYSLAHLTYRTGIPATLPASVLFQNYSGSGMIVGNSLIPAQISTSHTPDPMVNVSVVDLPFGLWYRFNSSDFVLGPKTITNNYTALDEIVVYVLEGSILVLNAAIVQSTQQIGGTLAVHVYGGKSGTFVMTEDDGDTTDYEEGLCLFTEFTWNEGARTLSWTSSGTMLPSAFQNVSAILFDASGVKRAVGPVPFTRTGSISMTKQGLTNYA